MKFKETNREECGIITDGDIHELPVHPSYLWGKNKRIFISHVLAKIVLWFSVLPAGIQPELSPPRQTLSSLCRVLSDSRESG